MPPTSCNLVRRCRNSHITQHLTTKISGVWMSACLYSWTREEFFSLTLLCFHAWVRVLCISIAKHIMRQI